MVIALAMSMMAPATAAGHVVQADENFACEDGLTYTTVEITSDDVTIDGCTFDGGGTTAAAIKNTVAGFSGLTVTNSTFEGYTGRTIALGFAEGLPLAGDRASDVTISNNTLGDMAGNAATSIAVFNTDGVTITGNDISNANGAVTGRRGINLDGNTAVRVQNNTINVGAAGAPWAVQVSMSDAPTSDLKFVNNTIVGGTYGLLALSQRDVTDMSITNNTITGSLLAVALNSGGVAPVDGSLNFSNIGITGNKLDGPVYLRNLHTPNSQLPGTASVSYSNVRITGNSITQNTSIDDVTILEDGVSLDRILVRGNR